MVRMKEIVGSGVRAEGFTPVMIYPKETPFIYYGQCIWRVYVHYIHDPHLKVLQSRSKPVSMVVRIVPLRILFCA